MHHDFLRLDELAVRLGRDRRELEKLVQRGRIPGHRVEGEWRFHPAEIRHWLEQEMRGYNSEELAVVEGSHKPSDVEESLVAGLLSLPLVQVPLEARTRRSVLESLVEVAGRTWQVWEPAVLLQAILEREEVLSTGFDSGVAMPHPRNPQPQALGCSLIAYGRTLSGVPFGAPRGRLSDIFFLVLCRDARTHLAALARLGRLLQMPGFIDDLREAADSASSFDVLIAADRRLSAG